MLVVDLIILILTLQWFLNFFGRSIIAGIPHSGATIYMLSSIIVILIIGKFLSWF